MCLCGCRGPAEVAPDSGDPFLSAVRHWDPLQSGGQQGTRRDTSISWARQEKGARCLTCPFPSIICEGSEPPQSLYKYHFQTRNCNWKEDVWLRQLIQCKLSSCEMHGKSSCHHSWEELLWYFRWPVVLVPYPIPVLYLEGTVSSQRSLIFCQSMHLWWLFPFSLLLGELGFHAAGCFGSGSTPSISAHSS